MVTRKAIVAIGALVAVLCGVAAIVLANASSTGPAPATRGALTTPFDRAV
jgi:hypothetical protein